MVKPHELVGYLDPVLHQIHRRESATSLASDCRAAAILAAPTLSDNKGTRLPGSAVIAVAPASVELAMTVDTCHGTAVSQLIAE
jgi:hypothetical protein